MSVELMIGVGRIVSGHPMKSKPSLDDDGNPRTNRATGEVLHKTYIGVAMEKRGEQNWWDTSWGQQIYAVGQQAFPNGEFQANHFAWKIEDGDSNVPNRAGKIPCQREGWAGHWIIHISGFNPIPCFPRGRYSPHEQMQQHTDIKSGDYVIVKLDVKGNNEKGMPPTPGVYLNPLMVELYQSGVAIAGDFVPDANEFANAQTSTPSNMQIDQGMPQQGGQGNNQNTGNPNMQQNNGGGQGNNQNNGGYSNAPDGQNNGGGQNNNYQQHNDFNNGGGGQNNNNNGGGQNNNNNGGGQNNNNNGGGQNYQ